MRNFVAYTEMTFVIYPAGKPNRDEEVVNQAAPSRQGLSQPVK